MRRISLPVVATVMMLMATPLVTPAAAGADGSCAPGGSGVYPVTGNWDGDSNGGDGIGAVVNSGGTLLWRLRNGPAGGGVEYTFRFGQAGDIPVTGNWDGRGGDGIGVVRNVGGVWEWYLRNGPNGGNGQAEIFFRYGDANLNGTVVGNWDSEGGDGPGVLDPTGWWYLRNAANAGRHDYALLMYGGHPAVANFDGRGGDGPASVVASGNEFRWLAKNSVHSTGIDHDFNYGATSGCPVTGNWDALGGDGPGVAYWNAANSTLEWHLRNGPSGGPADHRSYFP